MIHCGSLRFSGPSADTNGIPLCWQQLVRPSSANHLLHGGDVGSSSERPLSANHRLHRRHCRYFCLAGNRHYRLRPAFVPDFFTTLRACMSALAITCRSHASRLLNQHAVVVCIPSSGLWEKSRHIGSNPYVQGTPSTVHCRLTEKSTVMRSNSQVVSLLRAAFQWHATHSSRSP